MALLCVIIFAMIVIPALVYAKGLQENKEIYKDDEIFKHKLLNQNTTIIYFLFSLIVCICFMIYMALY